MSQALQLSLISGDVKEETVADVSAEDSLDAPLLPTVPATRSLPPAAPATPTVPAASVVDSVPVASTTSTSLVAPIPSPLSAETLPQAQGERSQLAQNAVNTPSSTTNGVQTVISDGLGTDIPSAAQNAAQNALTNVVGSFIDSTKLLEKRVEIQEGIRSQTSRIDTNIKEYSQGAIQHLEVLETTQQGGLTKVTAKVTVRTEDFKAYIKKLAEGKASVDVGLFSSLSIGAKQKENLEKIVVDLITPIAKGEVSRFEVGKPVSLDEGKKAIDGLYLKAMNKFDNKKKEIEGYRREIQRKIDDFSGKYDQNLIIYIPGTVTIDPGFYENARKTLESIAHMKNKYKRIEMHEFNGYYGDTQGKDIVLGVVGVQGSPEIGDVYTIKGIGIRIKSRYRWFAISVGDFNDAVRDGSYSFKDIAPRLEIDFVDVNGQKIKSFEVGFRYGNCYMDGSMLVPYPVDGNGDSCHAILPWSLLIASSGTGFTFPLIIPKREFGIFLALDESTLKNAKDVKLSLVPPPLSPK